MEIANNTQEKQEIQKSNNSMDIANIFSNEKLDKTIEDIENPEKVAENISNFINTTRKNYDNYA